MLNYTLTVSPSRLQVARVRPHVFRVRVANRNVANAILVMGSLSLGSSVLLTHPTLAMAAAVARRLTGVCNDAVVTPHPPPGVRTVSEVA